MFFVLWTNEVIKYEIPCIWCHQRTDGSESYKIRPVVYHKAPSMLRSEKKIEFCRVLVVGNLKVSFGTSLGVFID